MKTIPIPKKPAHAKQKFLEDRVKMVLAKKHNLYPTLDQLNLVMLSLIIVDSLHYTTKQITKGDLKQFREERAAYQILLKKRGVKVEEHQRELHSLENYQIPASKTHLRYKKQMQNREKRELGDARTEAISEIMAALREAFPDPPWRKIRELACSLIDEIQLFPLDKKPVGSASWKAIEQKARDYISSQKKARIQHEKNRKDLTNQK